MFRPKPLRPPFDPFLGQPHKLPPTPTLRQLQMQAAHRGRGPGGWQLGGAVGGFDTPPPGGSGDIWPGGCPSPKEHIQLANNDWILAGELKVGDEVMTSEEPQKVTRVQRLENRPRCEVLFEDSDSIVTSYSHPYFVNSKGFVEVGDLEKGDIIGDLVVKDKKPFAMGPVISLSVDKAETYMLQGGTKENPVPALSHNKSPVPPTIPQWILDQWAAQQAAREEARRKAAAAAARAQAAAARRANQAQRKASRSPGGWYAGGDVDVDSREALMAEREMLQQQLQTADEAMAQEIMAQIMEINKELEMAAAPGMAGGGIADLQMQQLQQFTRPRLSPTVAPNWFSGADRRKRNQHLAARGLPMRHQGVPIPYARPVPPWGG